MIMQMDIENFALFQKARLSFSAGFNVLTGESGSGKSLALESLVSVFGARLSPERIGPWGEQLRVSLVLQLTADDSRWELLRPFGIEPDDVLILERQLGKDGRSLYRAQGQVIPAQVLRTMGEMTIQYVGQHQLLRAANRQYVLEWVDRYGELMSIRQQVHALFVAWQARNNQVKELERLASGLPELPEKRLVLEELLNLQLVDGEDERIQQELQRLRAGRRLLETSQELYERLDGSSNRDGLLAGIAEITRLSSVLKTYDSALEVAHSNIAEAAQLLQDVRIEVSRWREGLDLDPVRLEELETRADLVSRVKRRFGPELKDVLRYLETVQEEIQRLENFQWEVDQAMHRTEEAALALERASEELSHARQSVLNQAGIELTRRIQEMEMPTGQLMFQRESVDLSDGGHDMLEIYFSANQGQEMKPLAKVASGGELARIALALAVTGPVESQMIYVFDEVDQGLGGASAERVGHLLDELGQVTQVLAVSHQSVVAARAETHLLIQKEMAEDKTQSTASPVKGQARVREVARMLSGATAGVALQHAEVLLSGKGHEVP